MKASLIAATLFAAGLAVNPIVATDAQAAAAQQQGETIKVKVKGLFCDLCRTKMQKSFGKIDGVTGVDVDLDAGFVTIAMAEGNTIADAKIKNVVLQTGYAPVSIARS